MKTSLGFSGLVMLTAAALQAEVACLKYEPEVVSLTGSVILRTFADAMDRAERVALLLLDEPICVEGTRGDELNGDEGDIIVVHLALPSEYRDLSKLEGRRVVARGSLYHKHTCHHHADVLMTVKSLELVNEQDRERR